MREFAIMTVLIAALSAWAERRLESIVTEEPEPALGVPELVAEEASFDQKG